MAKAQKGDLIRITNADDERYENGDIFEVGSADSGGTFVTQGEMYVYDHEYEIHRKAGEEDARVYTCDHCESKLGESCCTSNIGGNFCSVRCSDAYVGSVRGAESEQDAVSHPNHYTQGRFETIEVIEEITQGYSDGYVAYCVGNALKYLARAPFKHGEPTEDLAKAAKYVEFALARLQTQK